MTFRIATYVRVAQAGGPGTVSLDRHSGRLRAAAARVPGCLPVASYADVGEVWWVDRPGLAQMLADAAACSFEVLFVEDLGQLATDPGQLHAVLTQLAAVGVAVHPLWSDARRSSAAGWAAVAFVELLGG